MQDDLFASAAPCQHIALGKYGSLKLYPKWLSGDEAARCFEVLRKDLDWQQPTITLYGQSRLIPRLQVWFGDPEARMNYSGTRFNPMPWHPELSTVRQRLRTGLAFDSNSVLVNLYRDGQDSVSWHADDEPELGPDPVIASISLGAERRFSLRPKSRSLPNASHSPMHIPLAAGDLLIMEKGVQRFWRHALLKDKAVDQPRINLTFRSIR